MDRISEFHSFLPIQSDLELPKTTLFYETLYFSIVEIASKSLALTSFNSLSKLEKELLELQERSNKLLNSIDLLDNSDLTKHFDGIKFVLNSQFKKARRKIKSGKDKILNKDIELKPEKAKPRRHAISEEPIYEQKADNIFEMQQLEQENIRIVEQSQYEETRQRLISIETVQIAINENLIIQDERIDAIIDTNKSTIKDYDDMNRDFNNDKGSIFRRILFNIIICLSFILLFLHIFYKVN